VDGNLSSPDTLLPASLQPEASTAADLSEPGIRALKMITRNSTRRRDGNDLRPFPRSGSNADFPTWTRHVLPRPPVESSPAAALAAQVSDFERYKPGPVLRAS